MHRVRVKIEGLRDPATAVRAAEMGADAIGLVFAESPRRVAPEQAREIVCALQPHVTTVGVFVNASADEINRTVERTGIAIVQLHGDEPPSLAAKVRALRVKAFRVRDENWTEEVGKWLGAVPDTFLPERSQGDSPRAKACENASDSPFVPRRLTVLLDAYDSSVRGGSGKRFNWDWIAQARERGEMEDFGPIILAGGLNPDCVAEAIRKVLPWGVDVASGVESSPGVKDLGKVRAFLDAVRDACR